MLRRFIYLLLGVPQEGGDYTEFVTSMPCQFALL